MAWIRWKSPLSGFSIPFRYGARSGRDGTEGYSRNRNTAPIAAPVELPGSAPIGAPGTLDGKPRLDFRRRRREKTSLQRVRARHRLAAYRRSRAEPFFLCEIPVDASMAAIFTKFRLDTTGGPGYTVLPNTLSLFYNAFYVCFR